MQRALLETERVSNSELQALHVVVWSTSTKKRPRSASAGKGVRIRNTVARTRPVLHRSGPESKVAFLKCGYVLGMYGSCQVSPDI